MKRYQVKINNGTSIPLSVLCFLLLLADCYFVTGFQERLVIAILGLILFFVIMYIQSGVGCGFFTLQIDEKKIQKIFLGYLCTCTIPCDSAYVHSFCYKGKWYRVFSNEDLSDISLQQIWKLSRKRQVIVFPFIPKMDQDFPELFSKDPTNPYQNDFFLKR